MVEIDWAIRVLKEAGAVVDPKSPYSKNDIKLDTLYLNFRLFKKRHPIFRYKRQQRVTIYIWPDYDNPAMVKTIGAGFHNFKFIYNLKDEFPLSPHHLYLAITEQIEPTEDLIYKIASWATRNEFE